MSLTETMQIGYTDVETGTRRSDSRTAQAGLSVGDGLALLVFVTCIVISGFMIEESRAEPTSPSPSPSLFEHDCTTAFPTGQWDKGKCMVGARDGLWTVLVNGTNTHDVEAGIAKCKPSGELSCEHRQSAWSEAPTVLAPLRESGRLVVFLPGEPRMPQQYVSPTFIVCTGTGGPPNAYSSLLEAARSAGHHVIGDAIDSTQIEEKPAEQVSPTGLTYLSQPIAVSQNNFWCLNMVEPGKCNAETHETMLFGRVPRAVQGASSQLWQLSLDQSVTSVLVKVLRKQSWGHRFLSSSAEQISWSKVVISGHSQGAGHAAYLSYRKAVTAVLFSGPQVLLVSNLHLASCVLRYLCVLPGLPQLCSGLAASHGSAEGLCSQKSAVQPARGVWTRSTRPAVIL